MTSETPDGEERPAGTHPAVRTAVRALTVLVLAAVTLTGSLAVAGPLGLVVAADCLAAVGLLLALTGVPRRPGTGRGRAPAQPRMTLMPNETWWNWPPVRWLTSRLAADRRGEQAVRATEFPTYLKISSDLGWAPVSRWHYDHGTRPLLARLLEAALAEGQRVDVSADPARARRLAGEEVWRLVAPGQHHDSNAPGVDLRTLGQITDRLEQLWPDPLEKP
jgi:hypothetical protein